MSDFCINFAVIIEYTMQEIKNISSYRKDLREKILGASIDLFAKRGIRAVRMDDIANELSISKRTLYEIYDNKEDLLLECMKRYNMQKKELFMKIVESCDNVMDILLNIYRMKIEEYKITNPQIYSDLEKYPKVLEYFENEAATTSKRQRAFMQRGVEEGFFRADVNYELVSKFMEATHKYVMANRIYIEYPMDEVFHNIIFVSLRGFCTIKGIEVLDKFMEGR